jgi:hypothetical protein
VPLPPAPTPPSIEAPPAPLVEPLLPPAPPELPVVPPVLPLVPVAFPPAPALVVALVVAEPLGPLAVDPADPDDDPVDVAAAGPVESLPCSEHARAAPSAHKKTAFEHRSIIVKPCSTMAYKLPWPKISVREWNSLRGGIYLGEQCGMADAEWIRNHFAPHPAISGWSVKG